MSLRFLIRGTTAIACVALATTAVLSPAQAAAQSSPVVSKSWGSAPFAPMNPAIPSDNDIAKAKLSEAATAAESAKIDAILSSANDRLQGTNMAAMRANNTYSDALTALGLRRAAAETAKAKADVAAKEYKSAKTDLAQLAGNLYKSGGMNLDVQTFLVSSNADDAIYQASTLMALTANRSATFASAEASAATSAALQAQAQDAQAAADKAAKAAEDSKSAAVSATDQQAAVVKENSAQRDAALKQLAALHNTTVELEGARVDALTKKAQEEALTAQIKNSANVPAPVRPPTPGQGNGNQPVQPPPPPVTQPDPPVAPPVVTPDPPVVAPPVVTPQPVTPPPAGSYINAMVSYAMAQQGKSYLWGGTGPNAFDCSGLVWKAFQAAGVPVPRTGTDQYWAAPTRVPLSQAQYGDLVVFDSDGNGNFGHIAIYIGNGQAVQALFTGYPVGVYSIASMTNVVYPYVARY
ncbi:MULTISPECIES: C40 family peptidase [Arthrobacter]|uniref:C40 family peptidase n=1 Tax=Arthrobacter TaxID=1663 RepID=UPI0007861322|nr:MULTISPECIES: C40 family peptidase [Arthrobacter]